MGEVSLRSHSSVVVRPWVSWSLSCSRMYPVSQPPLSSLGQVTYFLPMGVVRRKIDKCQVTLVKDRLDSVTCWCGGSLPSQTRELAREAAE
jgi:hypothetical protein